MICTSSLYQDDLGGNSLLFGSSLLAGGGLLGVLPP
jgi:hypothetical protein